MPRGMRYSRWTIVPPWLGQPRLSSSRRGCLFLPGWCLSVKYLAAGHSCGQVVEQERMLKTAIPVFPSTNKTGRSWFVKLNLCRKVDLSVIQRGGLGAFCPSLCAGKVCGWEKKKGEPQWYSLWYFLLLLLSRDQTREHPGLSSSTIDGDAANPPCFLGLVLSLVLFPSVFPSCLCFTPPPRLKLKKKENYYCLRELMAISESHYWL